MQAPLDKNSSVKQASLGKNYLTGQAIILAAGLGKRLRPLTNNLPKVMLPIGGKSLLEYHLRQFKKYGIREIFINLHHLPEKITDYFGDGSSFGVKINYNFEEEILGTAGAIPAFSDKLKSRFILIYGDILTNFDYRKLIDFDLKKRGVATIVVRKTEHPQDSDLVVLDKKNRIKKFYFKPHKKIPNEQYFGITGIYVLSKEILKFIKPGMYSELDHQILPEILAKKMPLYGFLSSDYIRDIGTIERYNKAKANFKKYFK